MYNSDLPKRAALPSSRQLFRSTILAVLSAIVILITIVLPSEHGIDPTGAGRALGLTEMGEIKIQLEKEADADRKQQLQKPGPTKAEEQSGLLKSILSVFLPRTASAQTAASDWKDEISISLKPGQGTEVKLIMKKGAEAEFSWSVDQGVANYDLHGDGAGKSISYKKGRGVPGDKGSLKAAFDGNHGWFWRNRTRKNITVKLQVKGDYTRTKRNL